MAVVVTAADVQDREGARQLLGCLRHQFSRLRRIWADQAYTGGLGEWVRALRVHHPVPLESVPRSPTTKGLIILPTRWIVERTLGWLNRYRRLSKAYEDLIQTSEAMIRVAMIHLMIRRLARIAPY